MSLRVRLSRSLVILFCLWHMAAVFVYGIPEKATGSVVQVLRGSAPVVNPYLWLTSQWQMWNLFSPDPIRRFTVYRIDTFQNGVWVTQRELQPRTAAWWRTYTEFAYLRTLEDLSSSSALSDRYVQAACEPLGLAPGTPVRFTFRFAVLPKQRPTEPDLSVTKGWGEYLASQTVCPEPGNLISISSL